jgi:hypothetical protein
VEEEEDEALARRLEAGELLGGEAFGGGVGSSDADEAMARQYQLELNGESSGHAYDSSGESEQDARLAAMMQHMEMERGGVEADGEGTSGGGDDFAGMRLEDPVWGTLVIPEGSKPKPLQILCFAVCPCCAGAVCVRRRRGPTWLRWSCPLACAPQKAAVMGKLGRTLSAWLALAQLFFVCTSIALSGGFAPTWINPMLGATLKDSSGRARHVCACIACLLHDVRAVQSAVLPPIHALLLALRLFIAIANLFLVIRQGPTPRC